MMNEFWRKWRAYFTGYFWIKCPICGRNFAGFEAGRGSVLQADGKRKVCCRDCDYEAGKIDGLNGTVDTMKTGAGQYVDTTVFLSQRRVPRNEV